MLLLSRRSGIVCFVRVRAKSTQRFVTSRGADVLLSRSSGIVCFVRVRAKPTQRFVTSRALMCYYPAVRGIFLFCAVFRGIYLKGNFLRAVITTKSESLKVYNILKKAVML